MAESRRKVSKAPARKTARKATKPGSTKKAAGGDKPEFEKQIKIPLGGRFVNVRITIASSPKVGHGPRPKMDEVFLFREVDENRVLTLCVEVGRLPTAAPKVGSGGPPTGGN